MGRLKEQALRYPYAAGHRGVDTSVKAAESLNAKGLAAKVLRVIEDAGWYGMTSDEIADALGIKYGNVQPRTSELRKQHLIFDSGERRPSAESGKPTIVWRARRYR